MLAALERQDKSCTYIAHHELESFSIIVPIVVMQVKMGQNCSQLLHSPYQM